MLLRYEGKNGEDTKYLRRGKMKDIDPRVETHLSGHPHFQADCLNN